MGSSNLVAVEPGAIREDTPAGSVIQYSDYELDTSSQYAGGAAWIEGEFLPASDARISIFDTGFGHSDCTYTVAHVWHGNVFRLGDHLDRLLDGARKLRLDAGMSRDELADVTKKCISLSQLRESFVNLTITRGYGKKKGEKDLTKLTHQVYVYAIPYLWAFPPAEQIFGTTAIVPRHVRRAGLATVDPTIKNYQWGDLTAASFEAKDRGARTAILLDADNQVAEGPGFNVCIVKDGRLASPSRNALPGITRKTVFEIADEMGIEATLRDVSSRELYDADELIAVTTAGGVTPINTLDGVAIGEGTPGPLTTAIRDRFWRLMDEPGPLIEATRTAGDRSAPAADPCSNGDGRMSRIDGPVATGRRRRRARPSLAEVYVVPNYRYACGECGDFVVNRPMAQSSAPTPCPGCQSTGRRVFGSPALASLDPRLRTALDASAGSADSPAVVSSVPGRSRRATPVTRDPRHARLPRP